MLKSNFEEYEQKNESKLTLLFFIRITVCVT